jgi:hypothetical protein
MEMKAEVFLFLILASLVLESCNPTQQRLSTLPFSSPTMENNTQTPLDLPTQGDGTQMTPSVPALKGLIVKAKEDLAKRLAITLTGINMIEATEVVWPDSSLGCPQKGMAYAEVLTPGYLILLEYNNTKYEYHAGKGPEVIYCINPTPPIPGTPGNT